VGSKVGGVSAQGLSVSGQSGSGALRERCSVGVGLTTPLTPMGYTPRRTQLDDVTLEYLMNKWGGRSGFAEGGARGSADTDSAGTVAADAYVDGVRTVHGVSREIDKENTVNARKVCEERSGGGDLHRNMSTRADMIYGRGGGVRTPWVRCLQMGTK